MLYNMQDRFSIFAWEQYHKWNLKDQYEILELLLQTIHGNQFYYVEGNEQISGKKRNASEMSSEDGTQPRKKQAFTVTHKVVRAAATLVKAR